MQAQLLRVLETGEVTRVGATDPRRFDVHVVAATNRDLARDAVVGRFRSDLFYRNVVDIRVPSLRERPGDEWLLANTFVRQAATRFGRPVAGLSEEAAPVLAAWDWPGNLRELRNTIERAVMMAIGPLVTCADLRCGAPRATDVPSPSLPGLRVVRRIDDLEREAIAQALADTRGNKKEAVRRLGISRRALYRRIEKFGLDRVARAA